MSNRKTGMVEWAMRNRNIVIILSLLLMAAGIAGLLRMPRNEYPQFTIRQGVIVGLYPGATSAEVENQLTRIVENYIFSYQEIKKAKTYSYSREGVMYIFVELNDDIRNADQFWSKLKHGLNELKMTLPAGVVALVANSDFGDTSALLISISSDTRSYKELEEQIKILEEACRKIPATSKVRRFGLQKEKIFIRVRPEMLNEYNIKSMSLLGSYQLNGITGYAGTIKDGQYDLAVHLPSNFKSETDLAEQIVYSDPKGNTVRLKDIATIERQYEDPDNYIRQNGRKAILLSLEMQPGNNIVEFGREVDKALDSYRQHCPKGIQIAKISELPKYVSDSVSDFLQEFLIAIAAVILVTMLLLPLRIASVAAVTIPIAVLITLGIAYLFGIELNMVTLSSMILVLGMIVDNSIVVIDNHLEKIDQGLSPWHAAIRSARELAIPIITATLAICSAFFPLAFFLPGTTQEFLEPMPYIVTISLTISVVVALLLVPYLDFVFIKRGLKGKHGKTRSFLDGMQTGFNATLEKAFLYPKTVVGAGILLILLAVFLLSRTDQQLFPEMERNQFAVEIYLPTGTALERTAIVVDSLEKILLKDKRVVNVTSFTGTSSPRFHAAYAPNMPAPNFGQLLVNTVSDKATREVVTEYNKKYVHHFPGAEIKWKILALQQFTAPVEIRISADSIADIRKIEAQVCRILKETNGLAWVRNDWNDMQPGISVHYDNDNVNRLGLTKGYLAASLMTAIDGLPLTTIWEGDYPVEVRLLEEDQGHSITSLGNKSVTSLVNFSAVPLRSFATFTPDWNEGTIVRRNGERTLTILADNDYGQASSVVFDQIKPKIDKLVLPAGTAINYGGEFEGRREVFIPMTWALLFSIMLIFFIILFQFRKVRLTVIIMLTMLLTLPGAAIGLKLTGYPFSLTAFVGITSLCGMTVRNGIILIGYAEDLIREKRATVREAAIAAGKRRMRPIFLTSAAASVGVIPMILSGSNLWAPLGTVICFGLILSMILTLYILPILYLWISSDKINKQGFRSLPAKGAAVMTIALIAMLPSGAQAQRFSLDSCKSLALLNNRRIRETKLDIAQSKEQQKAAFANYFPKVAATGFAFRASDYLLKATTPEMNLPVYDGNPANLINPTQFAYVPSLQLNLLDYMNVASIYAVQPVFSGGRIINGNRLAKIGTEISGIRNELTTSETLMRTEELYWNILSFEEKSKTVESYLRMLNALERDVQIACDAGLAQRTDLLKVQLKTYEVEVSKLQLANGTSLAKLALCQHIGIPQDDTLSLITDVPEPLLPAELSREPSSLVSGREELRLLDRAVRAEELRKLMDMGENLPQVAVGVDGYYLDMMKETSTNTLAFATVTIPISDWWGGSFKMRQNQARIESAKNKLTETGELLALQARQAANQLRESFFRIDMAEKSIEQAKENLKVTDDNYHAGVTTMSELLEAQTLYQKTRDEMTEAQCNFQVQRAKYLQAIGKYR